MNKTNSALLKAFEKGYKVNNDGDIINPKGNKLKKCLVKSIGYYTFGFKNGEKIVYKIKIHRLQAYQKYGNKIFGEGIEVRHKNNNALDNSWDNILIGTHSENMQDMDINIRVKKAIHASSFIKKYNYELIKEYYNKTKSYKQTMKEFKINSKGALYYIINK